MSNIKEIFTKLNNIEKILFQTINNIFSYMYDEIYVIKNIDDDLTISYNIKSLVEDESSHEFDIFISEKIIHIKMRRKNDGVIMWSIANSGGLYNKRKEKYKKIDKDSHIDIFDEKYELYKNLIFKHFEKLLEEKSFDYETHKLKNFEVSFYKNFNISRQVKINELF